ncbi:MAG: helix-turn-helix transcriptional regulator [Clostridia bacterium]|jgi:transcriptional regulator with XRE-family HTH domain|nr:helix-turn-helix transcriptional regulator [Clostridia bacterium]
MTDLNQKAIGTVLKRLRKKRRLSQEVLSGFAGIARSHLAMIEAGTKLPNLETIWKLSGALNIAPHELIELIEKENDE